VSRWRHRTMPARSRSLNGQSAASCA
jgi:hypothetical protein